MAPQDRPLALLETLVIEFQCPAVFGDRSDDLLRDAAGDLCLDFKRHRYVRSHQSCKMSDDLICDAASITAYASWVETHAAVKALW